MDTNQKSSKPVSRILFPDSVSGIRTPAIYLVDLPPGIGRAALYSPVYVIFQPVRRTVYDVATITGRLLPCLLTLTRSVRQTGHNGRLFSSPLLCPRGHLPFRKCGALCCPDFPPFAVTLEERQSGLLPLICYQVYHGCPEAVFLK